MAWWRVDHRICELHGLNMAVLLSLTLGILISAPGGGQQAAALSASRTTGAAHYTISPQLPPWVEPHEASTSHPAKGDRSDVYELLYERQENAVGQEASFYHRAIHILSPEGVSSTSQINIEYEPSFETLTLHYIRLRREAQIIDALEHATLRVLHQEEELERRVYNGHVSLHALLEDVRPGDVLEYAYTLTGNNPAYRGGYNARFLLGSFEPMGPIIFRLVWPKDRYLAHRTHGVEQIPTVENRAAETIYTWRSEPQTTRRWEDKVPEDVSLLPWGEVSSFSSWEEVRTWGTKNFELPTPIHTSIVDIAEKLKKNNHTPEAQVRAALRFVQEDVRYFAISFGTHAFIPHPPQQTLKRRFGDCKDKTFLLINLLSAMNIPATPVLVHSSRGPVLPKVLPSIGAFDHVVARVVLDEAYIIDATATLQRGGLEDLQLYDYHWGLELAGTASTLSQLPSRSLEEPDVVVHEKSWVEEGKVIGHLEVISTYTGDAAWVERSRIANTSRSTMAEDALNFYARQDPSIEIERPLEVEDDQKRNVLQVREYYRIPRYWSEQARSFDAWLIDQSLEKPSVVQRQFPFILRHPLHVRQIIEFKAPRPWNLDDQRGSVEGDAYHFEYAYTEDDATLRFDYTLRSKQDRIQPARVQAHVKSVGKILESTGHRIWIGRGGSWSFKNFMGGLTIILVFIGGVFAFTQVPRLAQRLRMRRFLNRQQLDRGEAPETAIDVEDWEQALAGASRGRCTCGSKGLLSPQKEKSDTLRYDGVLLVAVPFLCGACGNRTMRYFKAPAQEN